MQAAEETKKLTAETSARCTDPASLGARFASALADLEKKCAARKAAPGDFQRLRNLVILSGRVPRRPDDEAPPASGQTAMLETLDRIQKRAALGQPAAEDFQALRQRAAAACAPAAPAEPPRAEASKSPVPAPAAKPAPAPAPSAGGPADTRQRAQRPSPKPQERPTPDRKEKEKGDPDRGKP